MDLVRRPGESDLHYDARLIIEAMGQAVEEIKHVEPGCITFTDPHGVVRTGWTYRQGIRTRAFIERGMSASPSIELPPKRAAAVEPDEPPEMDDA